MFGLIGKIRSIPDQRDALASILIQSTSAMPGCLSYVVAIDRSESDALWVTQVWDSSRKSSSFAVTSRGPTSNRQSHSLQGLVNALRPSRLVATAWQRRDGAA
jgi:antibiotic biosynthesis monooxygenase